MKKVLTVFLLAICLVTFNVKADETEHSLNNEENANSLLSSQEEPANTDDISNGDSFTDGIDNSNNQVEQPADLDLVDNNFQNSDTISNNSDSLQDANNEDIVINNPTENNETNLDNGNTQDEALTNEEASVIPQQKVLVKIAKVDEENNGLAGAIMQVLDSTGMVLDEWTSTGENHEIELPDGTYTIHEVKAPEGYELAENQEFTVKVIVEVGYKANTEYPNVPCKVATTYYVEVKGIKHEVYCINQFLTEPGQAADYNGKILTPDDVRKYTQQVVYKDAEENIGAPEATYNHGHVTSEPIDVSDQTLLNQELYDKLMDIIYRRTIVRQQERFADSTFLPDEAISYITEAALKTYTNAGVTQIQRWSSLQPGDEAIYTQEGKYYWYLMHMYKDYVYDPDSPNGWRTEIGHGDALGNFARHWSGRESMTDDDGNTIQMHGTHNLSVDHPEYADYFYYLLGDDVSKNMKHPSDMHIYIYSAKNTDNDGEKYQNLLGVTGYLEDFVPQEIQKVVVNKYSNETKNVTIKKVWDDNNNQDGIRPNSISATLNNGTTVILNEENNWTATVNDLPKYDQAKPITYTWSEIKVDGYELSQTEIDETGSITTLTNKHVPQTRNLKVRKVWHDDGNGTGNRPESISISLMANSVVVETVTITSQEQWQYVFTDLPKYQNGQEIVYTVIENDVPAGYVEAYEGDMNTGFIIHNGLGQGDGNPPPSNPQTGDESNLYLLGLLLSIMGLIISKIYIQKKA